MATATNPSSVLETPATHQQASNHRAGTHRAGNHRASNLRAIPAARLTTVVDRTSQLTDEVLTSLEAGQRAAIDAVGQFVVTIEQSVPEEVNSTSEVAKKITDSGLEMAHQLSHTLYHLLRQLIDSTGKSLTSHDGASPIAVK